MDKNKPLIFLGSNSVMELYTETCAENQIQVAGIIDSDYYGNRETVCNLPVIDSEVSFDNTEKLNYYRENFVFFCAVNWQPVDNPVNKRNKLKRLKYIDLLNQHQLSCINIIDRRAKVSPSAKLGKGIYIGEFSTIDPRVQIDDFVNIYGQTHVGHDGRVGANTVIQRQCSLVGELTIEADVFVSSNVRLLKNHARISQGTFIHECIYLRRNTVPNEIVSLHGANTRRVRAYPCEVD